MLEHLYNSSTVKGIGVVTPENDTKCAETLSGADIIFLSGGQQDALLKLKGTKTLEAFLEACRSGKCVVATTSASAMSLSENSINGGNSKNVVKK